MMKKIFLCTLSAVSMMQGLQAADATSADSVARVLTGFTHKYVAFRTAALRANWLQNNPMAYKFTEQHFGKMVILGSLIAILGAYRLNWCRKDRNFNHQFVTDKQFRDGVIHQLVANNPSLTQMLTTIGQDGGITAGDLSYASGVTRSFSHPDRYSPVMELMLRGQEVAGVTRTLYDPSRAIMMQFKCLVNGKTCTYKVPTFSYTKSEANASPAASSSAPGPSSSSQTSKRRKRQVTDDFNTQHPVEQRRPKVMSPAEYLRLEDYGWSDCMSSLISQDMRLNIEQIVSDSAYQKTFTEPRTAINVAYDSGEFTPQVVLEEDLQDNALTLPELANLVKFLRTKVDNKMHKGYLVYTQNNPAGLKTGVWVKMVDIANRYAVDPYKKGVRIDISHQKEAFDTSKDHRLTVYGLAKEDLTPDRMRSIAAAVEREDHMNNIAYKVVKPLKAIDMTSGVELPDKKDTFLLQRMVRATMSDFLPVVGIDYERTEFADEELRNIIKCVDVGCDGDYLVYMPADSSADHTLRQRVRVKIMPFSSMDENAAGTSISIWTGGRTDDQRYFQPHGYGLYVYGLAKNDLTQGHMEQIAAAMKRARFIDGRMPITYQDGAFHTGKPSELASTSGSQDWISEEEPNPYARVALDLYSGDSRQDQADRQQAKCIKL